MTKELWLLAFAAAVTLFVSIFAAGPMQRLGQVLVLVCAFFMALGRTERPAGMRVMGFFIFGETVVNIISNLTVNR